uniref:Uncharacterized protein n=1 Tax=Spongospora subterranea TaxID=70186 RepID=A0A0H5QP79_9EUKA|eukprot:CRZ03838.1 hypothetical protein [Spongospora subterranea]
MASCLVKRLQLYRTRIRSYVKKNTCRISNAGLQSKLGPPTRYEEQRDWLEDLVVSRFQRGKPMTREEACAATVIRWSGCNNESFQKLLHDAKHLLTRLLRRINYADRAGSISQKVPSDWISIARASSAKICAAAKDLQCENVFNMDETFIYCITLRRSVYLFQRELSALGILFRCKMRKRESRWRSQPHYYRRSCYQRSSLIVEVSDQLSCTNGSIMSDRQFCLIRHIG